MLTVTRLLLKGIAVILAVTCLSGFSPFTSVTITVAGVEKGCYELEAVQQMIRDLGYYDAEVSHPTSTKSGFRSSELKGIFVVLDCNASTRNIELSFSQYSNRFTKAAVDQLDRLTAKLRDHFKDNVVSISEPE